MRPTTDERRPGQGGGANVKQQTPHTVSRTSTPRKPSVGGVLVVDLTDLDPGSALYWRDCDQTARGRLAAASAAPTGAHVIVMPGALWPFLDMFAGERLDHLGSIAVHATDARQVARWLAALRETAS